MFYMTEISIELLFKQIKTNTWIQVTLKKQKFDQFDKTHKQDRKRLKKSKCAGDEILMLI